MNCFLATSDYMAYLEYLAAYSTRFDCAVHAYCLMTNHVHLLLTPRAPDSCAALMKALGQCYVQRMNFRLERKGTLWEGRFRSGLVNSERHLLACYRYIELNPVRAGLVMCPEEYRWSSYRSNSGLDKSPLITPHAVYQALGKTDEQRLSAYQALFGRPLEIELMEDIRKATSGGFIVGSARRPRGRPAKARPMSPT